MVILNSATAKSGDDEKGYAIVKGNMVTKAKAMATTFAAWQPAFDGMKGVKEGRPLRKEILFMAS